MPEESLQVKHTLTCGHVSPVRKDLTFVIGSVHQFTGGHGFSASVFVVPARYAQSFESGCKASFIPVAGSSQMLYKIPADYVQNFTEFLRKSHRIPAASIGARDKSS